MGKVKEIFIEIQDQLGEDVEVTNEIFNQYLVEKGIIKETDKV